MKYVEIQDMAPGIVSGIEVQVPPVVVGHRETYFEWSPSSLTAGIKTREVSGGVLQAWHHEPLFREVELHADAEMFYFLSGTALMLFVDLSEGQPDLETVRVVRIRPGTQLIIPPGKGHFVPVAEGDEPVRIVVVAPTMDAPRVPLSDSVRALPASVAPVGK